MKRIFPMALVLSLIGTSAFAAELADAVVEKTLGAQGVSHSTKTHSRYGQTYADVSYKSAGKDLVVLRVGSPEQYALWKQAAANEFTPVAAVGDEAFQLKKFRTVCAKTRTTAVCVTPDYLDAKHLTQEQIVSLVRAAL